MKCNVTLKPYGSPPLPVSGQFTATIAANGKTINTTVYVTSGKIKHNLLSRYSAFDLSILHINVNDEPLPMNIHAVNTKTTSTASDVQHMTYEELAAKLTPLAESTE